MAILVNASEISKSFAARPLFDSITFSIESGDRIGLIGPNGAGKSTLLRILASQTSPDSGVLSFQRGLRVGFLEQVPHFKEDATALSSILEGAADPDDPEALALAYEILSKFDLENPEVLVEELSGGWKKRVALAREIMKQPDLLLLDEPTNHLDVDTIVWLEDFLNSAAFATLTITHDRLFLQKIASKIFELDRRNQGGLLIVKGDYVAYLDIKEQMIASQERREVVLKNTLRRETEWLRQGAKARTTKQQARIQRAGDLKDEVSELEQRNQVRTARIDFQGAEKNPKKLIEAIGISKSYGNRKIFSPFDLIITPGKKIGILGPNGCGKSTLIRSLLGEELPDTGGVKRSEHLSVAYFEQNRETLDPLLSLSKTICPQGEYVQYRGNRVHIRSYLDRFMFTPGQMDMAVGKLSGGEQSRLLIARLMLTEANFLVLDEPTNDLDMATLNVLEECLTEFSGAVLFVTHDRYFLDQVANQILAFDRRPDGAHLESFANLSQWEDWQRQKLRNQKSTEPSRPTPAPAHSQTLPPVKKKKLGFKEQRELDSMEANIHKAEAELAQATAASLLPENISNPTRLVELTKQMDSLQKEIDRLYLRWEELES